MILNVYYTAKYFKVIFFASYVLIIKLDRPTDRLIDKPCFIFIYDFLTKKSVT
jgi:hypothetical protein